MERDSEGGPSRGKLTPRPQTERLVFNGSGLDKSLAIELSRQCRSGFSAWNRLLELIDQVPPTGPGDGMVQTDVFGEIQNVLVCAGIVSGILWPRPRRSRTAEQKAASL